MRTPAGGEKSPGGDGAGRRSPSPEWASGQGWTCDPEPSYWKSLMRVKGVRFAFLEMAYLLLIQTVTAEVDARFRWTGVQKNWLPRWMGSAAADGEDLPSDENLKPTQPFEYVRVGSSVRRGQGNRFASAGAPPPGRPYVRPIIKSAQPLTGGRLRDSANPTELKDGGLKSFRGGV